MCATPKLGNSANQGEFLSFIRQKNPASASNPHRALSKNPLGLKSSSAKTRT